MKFADFICLEAISVNLKAKHRKAPFGNWPRDCWTHVSWEVTNLMELSTQS